MLSGSVRKSGDRLRVSAQLIGNEAQRAVWADLYDRNAAIELDRIAEFFDQAIALDSDFALARAGRAFVEYWRYVEGMGEADLALTYSHAEAAIALDPVEAFAHLALGTVRWVDGAAEAAIVSSGDAGRWPIPYLDGCKPMCSPHSVISTTKMKRERCAH